MATPNGNLGTSLSSDAAPSAINLPAKRKRDNDSVEDPQHANGSTGSELSKTAGASAEELQATIRMVVDILRSYDPTPSVLDRTLQESLPFDEPQAKRQKALDQTTPNTITTRQESNFYSSLKDVLDDIEIAVSDLLKNLDTSSVHQDTVSIERTTVNKVLSFRKKARILLGDEKTIRESRNAKGLNGAKAETLHSSNGASGIANLDETPAPLKDALPVLTVYGKVSTSKQMFSGLPVTTNSGLTGTAFTQHLSNLPNSVTITQLLPVSIEEDKRRTPTLGEIFLSATIQQPPQPPRPSKIATTRSNIVGWYQPSAVAAQSRSKTGSYASQTVSTGQWLDYSHASSPTNKKSQRERAISVIGLGKPQSLEDPIELETARLEALFRSAYSGFAPIKDESASIVPETTCNRIWWHKVGEKNFKKMVDQFAGDDDSAEDQIQELKSPVADEYESFKQAIENWTNETFDPSLLEVEPFYEKPALDKDVDEILEGITDLLVTLNSFQRNRHLQITPVGVSRSASLFPGDATTGGPSKPTEAETSTYEILKSQLTLMIRSLPPYAVARLDSDKLGRLGISTKVEVRAEERRGIMEEDEAAARARTSALNVHASTTPRQQPATVHRSNSASLYGNQYASAARPTTSTSTSYTGAGQTPVRTASTSWQRPVPSASTPYQPQRPPSNPQYRASTYTPTQSYVHQTPRPQASYQTYTAGAPSFNNAPTVQKYSTPVANYNRPVGQSYNTPQMTVPQTAPQARYMPSAGPYPQQGQTIQNGMNYGYGNGMAGRQASPTKPYSPQPASAQPQARQSFSTPMSGVPQARNSYLQASSQLNNSAGTPQSQPYHRASSSPYTSSFMTTEQQASMMERQRAQLAQQQGKQEQARIAAQAGAQLGGSQGASSPKPHVPVAAGGL